MTKNQEFQQELLEKVKPGVKASDLKKLKKSKSADDISSPTPPNSLLQDQLKEKQKTVEKLRESLENTNQKLTETTQELDNSLLARYEAVKQFGKLAEKLKEVRQELDENVDQASDELVNQDEEVRRLRNNQSKAQKKIRELEKDLNLAQKLAELRKYPLPNSENN